MGISTTSTPGRRRRKVLLLGLDGATFSVLEPMVARGVMPFLGRFIQEGARANLRTIVPALTPPAWTSLFTGRTPGHHGVFDFFRMDSAETRHIRFVTSRDVAVPTVWELAADAGLKVTALNFPLMFPPPRLNGYVVPGWVPWRQLRLACHPPDLFDRLKGLPGFEPRELAMDIKLEEKATEGCSDAEQYAPWIELHIRRERNWFSILRHLESTDPSDLTAVLFDGVDKLQHLCWRFIAAGEKTGWPTEWERRAHELCLAYFQNLDGILEQICAMAGPEAAVVIASDHGFGPTTHVFHVNTWLERQGYLAWAPDRVKQAQDESALLGVGQVARHTFMLDWDRTRAFATTPTSNGIFILPSKGNGGADAGELRAQLARELLEVRNPDTGERLVERVYTRDEAFPGPFMSTAPDLTLAMADGGLFSILPSERLVSRRPETAGAHRPLGVFFARGPGIRRDARIEELSILDVAPTLLHGLRLPVPRNFEGRVPEELFERAAWRDEPAIVGDPAERLPAGVQSVEPPRAALAQEDEAMVLKRLQELGYVE
jgi:predicted AlkP superfamily phosphohydrolase/phosphomutase